MKTKEVAKNYGFVMCNKCKNASMVVSVRTSEKQLVTICSNCNKQTLIVDLTDEQLNGLFAAPIGELE